MTAMTRALAAEHGVLLRQLARLQQRVSEQLQAAARRQTALESQNLRLRSELVRLRTAEAWGIATSALARGASASPARPPVVRADPTLRDAQAVICRTGCAGHAHPWLEEDGHCRRTGSVCERLDQAPPVK